MNPTFIYFISNILDWNRAVQVLAFFGIRMMGTCPSSNLSLDRILELYVRQVRGDLPEFGTPDFLELNVILRHFSQS